MKNIGIVALAAIVALVLGVGASLNAPSASAEVTEMQLIGCELLAAGVDGDLTDATAAGDFAEVCQIGGAFLDHDELLLLESAYGDDDGDLEPSDFQERDDLDGNQLASDCAAAAAQCTLLAFVWVDDEAPVLLDSPAGLASVQAGAIDFTCGTADASAGVSPGATLTADNDCFDDPANPNNGDGVVIFGIINDTADPGDSPTVRTEQEGGEATADVNVVGIPDEVELVLLDLTLQEGVDADAIAECEDDFDVTDGDVLTDPSATIAIAFVTDADGTDLARVTVDLESDDTDIATIATGTPGETTGNTGQTVVSDEAGTAQFAVVCAGDTTGVTDITATINAGTDAEESNSVALTVVGAPDSIALTASPAVIACDGTQTSTVTATVTDSAGDNVANGVDVNFSVVALGTANPINADTVDGVASSVITPLSNASAGVTVIVSAGEAQSSIRVDCSLPIAPVPTAPPPGPVATPTQSGTIGGPDTGSGGYLGQDSSSGFPMWTLIALGLGSIALVAGGLVTRRAGK